MMNATFAKALNRLKKLFNRFDDSSSNQKRDCLAQLSKLKLACNKSLLTYQDLLLFICSHPGDKKLLSLAEKELSRISKFMKQKQNRNNKSFENSGLPYSSTVGGYSHDLVRYLLTSKEYKTELSHFGCHQQKLNEILRLSLPSVEREQTAAGMTNEELMDHLLVKKENRLPFILNEVQKLDHLPLVKDHLFDELEVNVCITPLSVSFSKIYNRIKTGTLFFHTDILKNFNSVELINTPVPQHVDLGEKDRARLVSVIRNSLTLTIRETDPSTYMDENSIRMYELDRGISVVIYGMIPQRQLPLESYVGYTLFKNGYPAAYGGAWVFGKRALFGINIFESFRGGESGYLMCQLLRVYRQVFKISYFEVEPYQYGEDNPEGIDSAAFWFYYKHGFRPLDKKLLKLAEEERKKFRRIKNYRSGKNTLMEFIKSNIALNLENGIPPTVGYFTGKITKMIEKKFGGDRKSAAEECINKLRGKPGDSIRKINFPEHQALEEVAFLSEVTGGKIPGELLIKLIHSKPTDLYTYQENLLTVFKKING